MLSIYLVSLRLASPASFCIHFSQVCLVTLPNALSIHHRVSNVCVLVCLFLSIESVKSSSLVLVILYPKRCWQSNVHLAANPNQPANFHPLLNPRQSFQNVNCKPSLLKSWLWIGSLQLCPLLPPPKMMMMMTESVSLLSVYLCECRQIKTCLCCWPIGQALSLAYLASLLCSGGSGTLRQSKLMNRRPWSTNALLRAMSVEQWAWFITRWLVPGTLSSICGGATAVGRRRRRGQLAHRTFADSANWRGIISVSISTLNRAKLNWSCWQVNESHQ